MGHRGLTNRGAGELLVLDGQVIPHHPAGTLRGVADSPDLTARVAALEARLEEVAADVAAARHLAAGADHDVSEVRGELRAHTRALNALRETQLEQGQAIGNLQAQINQGFVEVRGKLDQTAAGMDQIVGLLNTLTTRDDNP